jgi:glycogen synthase
MVHVIKNGEEQMKIVHLTDSFYPTIGGLERAIRTLSDWQSAQGHEVHVVTGAYPNLPDYEESPSGVKVWRYTMISQVIPGLLESPERPFHPTFKDPLTAHQLGKVFKKIQPDIIHSHGWSMYSAVDVAKKMGVPFLATARDYGYFCAVKQNLLDGKECSSPSLKKCTAHAIQHYGAVKGAPIALGLRASVKANRSVNWTGLSSAVTTAAVGSKYEIPDMIISPSLCPDNILEPTDEPKPEFLPDNDYICFIGGLYNEKGVGILLEAQQELLSEGLTIPLVLVGMPKHDSPDLNLPHVYHAVSQPHNIVMSVWRNATVGVVPSVIPEAFGQVAVECLAAGTPAVLARHGGLVDIMEDGVQGLFFNPGDAQDLKEKIKTLWLDKNLRAKMSEEGPVRAKKFVVSSVAPDIMNIYNNLVK